MHNYLLHPTSVCEVYIHNDKAILSSVYIIKLDTTGTMSRAGTVYPSGAPEFSRGYKWGLCWSIFSFLFSVL
jgi:hypothetical protein